MIPARMGSTRLPMKNFALLYGKPLIYYAVQAAKEAGIFKSIIINSDDILFSKIAKRYDVEFYHRPVQWATSTAKSDLVVYDFIRNNPCDIVAWVNPTSPLQTGKEIRQVVNYFLRENLDSLITVKNENVHCIYKNKSINFKMSEVFARTQDLKPIQSFVYSVMMWRSRIFMRTFEKKGYAILSGKVGFYPVGNLSSVIVKKKEDLMLADYMMRAVSRDKNYETHYDRIVQKLKKGVV